MMEAHQLEAVWFCPTHLNPLRSQQPSASPCHRAAMVACAIAPFPSFGLITYEIENSPPSYTVVTLRALRAANPSPKASFFLILGDDSADTFFEWCEPEEIIKLATLVVGQRPRKASSCRYSMATGDLAAALQAGVTPTRLIDISSSEIRQRLCRNAPIEHLTPLSVCDYIQRHNLYT